MDDLLNDPRFPDRPSHPDFWALSDIILSMDGGAGEGGETFFERSMSEAIDLDSLQYMAKNRGIRMVSMILGGGQPYDDTVNTKVLADNLPALQVAMVAYLEAFLVGYRFANKDNK